mmetsp:Transcript_7048/g.21392  ORF Transcript_7048/g.21392 Transcript_7048/m.21392 type:complete len:258 (+) Transcript_7048:55-828(+)
MCVRHLVLGIFHFLERPVLWKKVLCPVLVTIVSTLLSLGLLFALAFTPQARLLIDRCHWPGWVAWPTAALLVLTEVSLVNLTVFLVLFGCTQSQIFRAVLEERGVLPKIRQERNLEELPEAYCCRDFSHSIAFLLARLPLLILTLPLNGLPVLGQVAWCFLNGWLYAWELTAEFMVMYEDRHHCGAQWSFVRQRFTSYLCFGAAAMGLELIPFIGPWVFFATNACGAAYLAEAIFAEKHARVDGAWEIIGGAPESVS